MVVGESTSLVFGSIVRIVETEVGSGVGNGSGQLQWMIYRGFRQMKRGRGDDCVMGFGGGREWT